MRLGAKLLFVDRIAWLHDGVVANRAAMIAAAGTDGEPYSSDQPPSHSAASPSR